MIHQHGVNVDCPHCGCNAMAIVEAGMRRGRAWARYQCDHCERISSTAGGASDAEAAGVAYNPVNCRCPKCGQANPSVTNSPRHGSRIRFHKCQRCGYGPFKSVEVSAG